MLEDGCVLGFSAVQAANTSETSVNFYQTTWRNNLEHSHPRTRRRENLKSHWVDASVQAQGAHLQHLL
jgi:hypothetical protein